MKDYKLNAKCKGGGGGDPPPPPIPQGPTEWLYDRNQNPVSLITVGDYQRVGNASDGQFNLVMRDIASEVPNGLYQSTQAASDANPKVWLYDSMGNTTKQIFKGGAGPDDTYDTTQFNLGPTAEPYRHWYDIYGVDQKYAPESTPISDGYFASSSLAPKSPDYKQPVALNTVDPDLVPNAAGSSPDLDAGKAQAQARQKNGAAAGIAAAMPGTGTSANQTDDTTGGGTGKTLVGQ